MQAAVLHAARDLRIEDRAARAPGAGEVAVRIRAGGICGSDLHYYQDGGFGTVRVREPIVLGHEIAGEVAAIGAGVTSVAVGARVAVNPSRACGACRYCLEGAAQHCLDMRFFGSAMRMPHVQGGFSEELICDAAQAVPLPADMDLTRAAFAEPLAVCLHAARQAGDLQGKRVLVTGAGPIGALCVLVARHAGAREIVATDLADAPLALVRKLGADRTLNLRADAAALDPFAAEKGYFDAVLEASGSAIALGGAFAALRPGGTIVQVGIGGAEWKLPINTLVAKEITLRGTFRFHAEFALAVDLLASRRIDPMALLTTVMPLADAVAAFDLAADRGRAMKVQLAL
ncbi:MAG: L-idonate 5-dehydrogenase [Rhodospirillales bacterium]|nr:L-idonate 5-dehydrogenase [Rhodospirillales bacterium]